MVNKKPHSLTILIFSQYPGQSYVVRVSSIDVGCGYCCIVVYSCDVRDVLTLFQSDNKKLDLVLVCWCYP